MNNNYQKIIQYLKSIKKYQIKSTKLNENIAISLNYKLLNEDINNINKDLITILIKNKLCKSLFFDKIEDVYVFNQNKFIEVIFNTNEYMDGSYTKHSSKIGLFLKDEDKIQLNFPYKDCVLVGGMDKEDDKVNLEVFYNEILERDKIDKLFEPKVFHNIKKYTYDKELAENDVLDNPKNIQVDNNIDNIKFKIIKDEDGNEKEILQDNLLIKGNNLLGLHSLAKRMNRMIDVIYIDPPYYFNNKKTADSFAYNSNFKLSTWLTFMKNRLEIAKELLSDTGVIFISMNEDGNSYLKLLCDDIFGVDNNETIIWKKVGDGNASAGKMKATQRFRNEHEYILCLYKNKNKVFFNKTLEKPSFENEYKNLDNDPRGPFKSGNISKTENKSNINGKNFYTVFSPDKTKSYSRQWHFNKEKFDELNKDNRIYWGKSKNGVPQLKIFIEEKRKTTPISLLLKNGSMSMGLKELSNLMKNKNIDNFTPKPLKLIKYLLKISSKKDSIILDFFAGSGTTAHSMLALNKEDDKNRKFILIEQMDYIKTFTKERIKRSMIKENYEDNFIYMEMKESKFKEIKNKIKSSKNKEELITIINNNFDKGYFINIDNKEQLLSKIENIYNQIKKKKITKTNTIDKYNQDFLLESIKLIIEKYMDNNLDYISYEDIEELKTSNKIKNNEYKLNNNFYKGL